MGIGFCFADTATKICPKCGTELTNADYYTAVQGASTVVDQKHETDWARGKTTTTTTTSTQYSDIRQHTGAVCMYCCYKKLYISLLIARIMIVVGVVSVAFSAIQLLFLETNETWVIIIGVIGLVMASVGWRLMGNDGLINPNPYKVQKGITPISTLAVHRNDTNHDYVSRFIVQNFPKDKIQQGRVVLSRGVLKK